MFELNKKITLIVTIAIISVFSFSFAKDAQGDYTFTVKMSNGCDCSVECSSGGSCNECFGGYCCDNICGSSGCLPVVETNSATNIATSSVQLNGNLAELYGESSADIWFQWGETDNYGSETASSTVESTGTFNTVLSGLSQGQSYHFMAMAETANGTSSGVDMSFTTIDGCLVHNVGGWAWSENIGWISMSCENCDQDNNSYTDVACGGDNSSEFERDYGIDISDSTGIISAGEVWSPNIGWISFDYEKTGTPPAAPDYSGSGYLAKMSTSTYELSGWTRALAASSSGTGEWDGWIKLGWDTGSATGTISLNNSTHEFDGYAWGGDDTASSSSVIGWLSFNDIDYDGSAGSYDYQVTTTLSFGPTISNLSDSYLCPCEQSRIPALSWEADQEGSYIYQVQIDSDGGSFASPKIAATSTFSGTSGSWTPVCSYCCLIEKDNILWNTAYDWRVRIKIDSGETWSSWEEDTDGFTTPIHCYPYSYFLCSYDEVSWYDCDGNISDGKCGATGECIGALPHDPAAGQDLYIKDVSTCYNDDDTSFDAQDCSTYPENDVTCPLDPPETTTYYQWSLENITSNSGSDFATSMVTIGEGTEWTISATTTDTHSPDQECGQEERGDVGLPLPEWKEVAPF